MTGLQWAVLQAYARALPLGAERFAVRSLAYAQRPEHQGAALVAAAGLGYIKNGHITRQGDVVACEYLSCEDVSASGTFSRTGVKVKPPEDTHHVHLDDTLLHFISPRRFNEGRP